MLVRQSDLSAQVSAKEDQANGWKSVTDKTTSHSNAQDFPPSRTPENSAKIPRLIWIPE